MTATIYSLDASAGFSDEEGTCARFLSWQGFKKIHFVQKADLLVETGGRNRPLVKIGDEILAVGFDDLYRKMNEKGMRLL